MERTQLTVWRGVEAAAALLVLGFFLFGLREILNPFLLFFLLWAVLSPFRGKPGHSELLMTAGALTLFWLLSTTGSLLAPFILSVVLAYMLDPLVDEDALMARLRDVDSATIVAFLQERREALGGWVWGSVVGMSRGLGAVVGIAGYVVLTPTLTFYLLRDWDRLLAGARDLIPAGRRDGILSFARDYDHLLGRYLRGQLTVALALGLITAVGLGVLRFPYAATLGLLVAVFSVVPYLGLLLSLLPAVFIALVSGSVGVALLKVLVVYGGAQMLEGAVISPRVVGDSVGLHPVWVVLALSVGGFFFGFVGLLLAVPGAVGVKLLAERAVARYRASAMFRGEESESAS